jgi:hypothetical protein
MSSSGGGPAAITPRARSRARGETSARGTLCTSIRRTSSAITFRTSWRRGAQPHRLAQADHQRRATLGRPALDLFWLLLIAICHLAGLTDLVLLVGSLSKGSRIDLRTPAQSAEQL